MKSINELTYEKSSTWNLICDWIKNSKSNVEIISFSKDTAENALVQLQISTKSVLGSIVYNTAGILKMMVGYVC